MTVIKSYLQEVHDVLILNEIAAKIAKHVETSVENQGTNRRLRNELRLKIAIQWNRSDLMARILDRDDSDLRVRAFFQKAKIGMYE